MSNLPTYEEWRDWAIQELHPSAGAWMAAVNEVTKLRAELAELRKDKARLDHLTGLTNTTWVLNGRIWQSSEIREAIDAAMQEGGEG